MVKFSGEEIRDIVLATAVLAFAFGGLDNFFVSLFIIGTVFLLHELVGHKFAAQYFGADAEFRAWPIGLALALITPIFGFIFAAPGAVQISPFVRRGFAFPVRRINSREFGLIALAGPAVNIVFGAILFALGAYYNIGLLLYTAHISFFLSLFNLFPIDPLDGAKVMRWSWQAWLIALLLSVAGYLV